MGERVGQRLTRLGHAITRSGTPGRRDDPLAAAFWITLSMALLAGLAACGKYLGQQGVNPLLIVFYRNVFCLLWLMPLLYWRGPGLLHSTNFKLYGVRVGVNLASMYFWFAALTMLPLAEIQATGFLAPLFATTFAILYLGEKVSSQRWMALGVGLLGALVILRPWGAQFGIGQMFALAAAFSIGIVGPLVKQLTATDDSDKIVFITNVIMTPVTLIPALFVWEWPRPELWLPLIAMGACASLGHVTMVRAFNTADASLVATFDFSRLPFAVLIGYYVFGESTDVWTWIGAVIIFGAAIVVTQREAAARALLTAWNRDVSDPVGLTPVRLRLTD